MGKEGLGVDAPVARCRQVVLFQQRFRQHQQEAAPRCGGNTGRRGLRGGHWAWRPGPACRAPPCRAGPAGRAVRLHPPSGAARDAPSHPASLWDMGPPVRTWGPLRRAWGCPSPRVSLLGRPRRGALSSSGTQPRPRYPPRAHPGPVARTWPPSRVRPSASVSRWDISLREYLAQAARRQPPPPWPWEAGPKCAATSQPPQASPSILPAPPGTPQPPSPPSAPWPRVGGHLVAVLPSPPTKQVPPRVLAPLVQVQKPLLARVPSRAGPRSLEGRVSACGHGPARTHRPAPRPRLPPPPAPPPPALTPPPPAVFAPPPACTHRLVEPTAGVAQEILEHSRHLVQEKAGGDERLPGPAGHPPASVNRPSSCLRCCLGPKSRLWGPGGVKLLLAARTWEVRPSDAIVHEGRTDSGLLLTSASIITSSRSLDWAPRGG